MFGNPRGQDFSRIFGGNFNFLRNFFKEIFFRFFSGCSFWSSCDVFFEILITKINYPHRIKMPSAQILAPSGENIFPEFSSIWVIFSLDTTSLGITDCVTRDRMSNEKFTLIHRNSVQLTFYLSWLSLYFISNVALFVLRMSFKIEPT